MKRNIRTLWLLIVPKLNFLPLLAIELLVCRNTPQKPSDPFELDEFGQYFGTASSGLQVKAEFSMQWNKAKHPAVAFHLTAYITQKTSGVSKRI